MSLYRLTGLLFLLSLLPQIGRSQPSAAGALVLKMAALSTADPNTSCLPLNLEYFCSPSWSVEASYAPRFRYWQPGTVHEEKRDFRYTKLRAEVRYYPGAGTTPLSYWAAEVFVIPQRYDEIGPGPFDPYTYQYDPTPRLIAYRKRVTGLAAKAGVMARLGPRWRLDVFGGLGLRWVRVRNSQEPPFQRKLEFLPKIYSGPELPAIEHEHHSPGDYLLPHVALNVKLGYLLRTGTR